MMNERQRYIATLMFQEPDRIPYRPGNGRRSTREAWHTQGLPEDVTDYHGYVRQQLGIDAPNTHQPRIHHGINLNMTPEFEEKVIETRPESQIVQDWKGNVCEIGLEFSPADLRGAPDFCTRAWLKCPVESRDDWPEIAQRYDPDDPSRFPEDFAQRCETLAARDYPAGLVLSGPFWQLREWCGFEGLCMLMLDDPPFVEQMIERWREFVAAMFDRAFARFVPDFVMVNEDMAYKEKPMIGPEMARRFLLPCWRRWAEQCRAAGVPIYEVDSDGHVGELIPIWLDAGFISNTPQEAAAGNDLPVYRLLYGERMAYRGGVDKRAMAQGGQSLRDEIDRLHPVIDAGGYIPSCDHAIPSDVSWPNFVEYCRLLAHATGWL